jgi:hypothetical protein
MGLYLLQSGAMPTTAGLVAVATSAAIKTIMQVKLGGSTNQTAKIAEWGISFDGSAAATPGKVELLSTKTVGATITEYVAADIINLLDPNASAVTDDFPFAFTAAGDESGYNATAEGTITATRPFDSQLIAPTNQYIKQFPLGREPNFRQDEFVRIRTTFGAGINCYAYMVIDV